MTQERREWKVSGHDEEPDDARVRHVVGRLGTVFRTQCDRYDGARVHHGTVVFGGTHEGHLISAVVGRDESTGALGVRLLVNGNGGARWAAIAFPLVMFGTLFVSAKTVEGAPGLLGGAALGLVLGALAAYGAYMLAPKLGLDSGGRGRVIGVVTQLEKSMSVSVEHMGLHLQTADKLFFAGLDDDAKPPVSDAWKATLEQAVGALAT